MTYSVSSGSLNLDSVDRSVGPQRVDVDEASPDRVLGGKRESAAVRVELAEDDVARAVVVEHTVRPVVRRSTHVHVLAVTHVCVHAHIRWCFVSYLARSAHSCRKGYMFYVEFEMSVSASLLLLVRLSPSLMNL